ncbi:MAG TPA: phosphoglucomutase/phosphomannomutase family protein [Terriglobia bacterium]|nr:phosphoglucomutase/phosphomannomutase family protein [Terriglobia bacterium]
MDKIKFGTDGWRGVIGEEFTFANLRRVATAVAHYIRAVGKPGRGLVIGYDTRFLSAEFAGAAAEVVAATGIPVFLADRATPTPAVSYAVVARQAAGAIMITASHNPYRWNGVKFKAPYGGSAAPAIVRRIETYLHKSIKLDTQTKPGRAAQVKSADLVGPYLARLKDLVQMDRIRDSGRRFVIDPMYGAGQGCLGGLFKKAGVAFQEIHAAHDPLFPGLNPEPIEPHVDGLRRAVLEGKFDAGFATDGDADRLGAIDRNGTFIDSHKIFSILLAHLAGDLKRRGEVVKTFSTTQMVDKLAAKFGLPLHVTPIGFKYICELMLTRNVLIGGEESGGIGVKGHLPERDGIYNSLLLAEVVAARNRTLGELVQELQDEFGPHHYGRVDLEIERAVAQRAVQQAAGFKGKRVGGLRVTAVDAMDGVKMLFEDKAWLLVRASGTENLLRLYAEAPSRGQVKTLLGSMAALARRAG